MKQLLLILFCLRSLFTFGQSITEQLKKIKTIEQAKEFVNTHPHLEPGLFTISSDKDTSDITIHLFEKKNGFTFLIDNYTYKIIESNSDPQFRVSYIYLDGSELSMPAIDSLRNLILAKYKSGIYFVDLVKEYTMDSSPNGDMGWFKEGLTVKEFETALRQHKQYDIFTVDISYKKWYYVVLKTYEDRIVKTLTILKIKNSMQH